MLSLFTIPPGSFVGSGVKVSKMVEPGGLVTELEGFTPEIEGLISKEPETLIDCKKYFFTATCRGSMSKRSMDKDHGKEQRKEKGKEQEQGKDQGKDQGQVQELEKIEEQNQGQECAKNFFQKGCRGDMRKRSEEQKLACSKYFFLPGCRGSTSKRARQEERAGRRQEERSRKGQREKLSSKTLR